MSNHKVGRVLAALLSADLMISSSGARAAAFDGDWEGDLRCEPSANAPAVYEPVLASVRGSDIKLLRGAEQDGDVVQGRIDQAGEARISGRATLADGARSYLNFSGRFMPGRFEGDGTAVPDSGGAVRRCSLNMQAAVAGRGEGAAPSQQYPGTPPTVIYGSGGYPVYGYPTWYDDNYWWRYEMLRRWQYRLWAREQEIRRYCDRNPRACGHEPVHRPPRPVPPSQRPPDEAGPKPVPPGQPVAVPGTPRHMQSPPPPVTVVRPERAPPPAMVPGPQNPADRRRGDVDEPPSKAPPPTGTPGLGAGASGSPPVARPRPTPMPAPSPAPAPAAPPAARPAPPPQAQPAPPPQQRREPPPQQRQQEEPRTKCPIPGRC